MASMNVFVNLAVTLLIVLHLESALVNLIVPVLACLVCRRSHSLLVESSDLQLGSALMVAGTLLRLRSHLSTAVSSRTTLIYLRQNSLVTRSDSASIVALDKLAKVLLGVVGVKQNDRTLVFQLVDNQLDCFFD